MEDNQTVDFWLLITALILAGVGLVMVYSSSMYLSMDRIGDGMYYFKKQALHLIVGLFLMIFLTKINYRGYAGLGTFLLFAGTCMLGFLLVQKYLQGRNMGRWIRIGKFGFQPSELMKIIVIIYFSAKIARMGEKVRDFKKGFLPLLCVLGIMFVLVVLEPDLGTAGFIIVVGMAVLFTGRAKLLHLLMITLPVAGAMALTVKLVPYMQKRVDLFLDPSSAHQVNQSLIGIGSGGIFGVGLGNSTQKFLFLPENHTDFVFSIFAEEMGLVGTALLLLIMLFYVMRGFKIAAQAPDLFGYLLASGISMMTGLQVFINISVATGLLPTTGMTLPFISYGGSSLILSFIATGILLNISKQGNYEVRLSREFGSRLHKRSVW
ncbi:MAG: cell division protein FtsW [Candidatus Latescibacteria bacterium]|jgi:cell division protein FtsW|nr:cell division protein FtsW [Candidatus Latescibacterota bacterium]